MSTSYLPPQSMLERPDDALNAWNSYYLNLYVKQVVNSWTEWVSEVVSDSLWPHGL